MPFVSTDIASQPPAHAINLAHKLSLFDTYWQPRVIAEMNDYQFKLVKIQGDFIMHTHGHTDEAFLVLQGQLRIEFQQGHVLVNAGELYVVPRGVANTGDQGGERTAPNDVWL